MSVNFTKPKRIGPDDIALLVKALGRDISSDVKKFFVELNGSKPDTNIFSISEKNESGISELIPASKILEERQYLDHVGDAVFPLAVAEGGNYVVIDLDQGESIYFWDHEEPRNMIKLASGIFEFLDALEPFDPEDVKLEEGQVESAWIDPDFLKSSK